MKVFLDTNVLASAAATRGLCADVLREVLACPELIISEQVLRELRHVLESKFGVREELIEDFLGLLQQGAILGVPGPTPEVKLRDKDEQFILAAAIAVGAEGFVTGDKELLGLGHVGSLKILSPRQFWEGLKVREQRRSEHGQRRQGED